MSMETWNVRETLKYWWEEFEYLLNHAGSASFTKTRSTCENLKVGKHRTSKEKSQSSDKGISDKENWTGNNIF